MIKPYRQLATALLSMLVCSQAVSTVPPNIIVIVADDLGWNDVGFHGGDIDTPSLDKLANEGVRLNRFYTTPICSPTRAALMTGRDPMRLGIAYSVILPWDNNGVHPEEHFMPESFRATGYQTAMVGKWHLGHAQMSYHPNQRGFEHFYGHLHTEVGYFSPFANMGGSDFQRNGETIYDEGYETFLLADEVTRFIRQRDKSKPFFIYMPFLAPHTPLAAPQQLKEKYANINTDLAPARSRHTDATRRSAKAQGRPSARPVYAAVVDAMDQAIGQVLTTLDEEQLSENTLVMFFSDNGGAAYSVGGADNAPLRGGKGETFEGGIRVVSLLRWPAAIKAGSVSEQVMHVFDVFPTLAAAAGVVMQNSKKLDGENLWPSIQSGQPTPRSKPLFFTSEIPIFGNFNFAAIDGNWKLVQEVKQTLVETNTTNWLFNLSEDPNEYDDLSAAQPQRVAALANAILDWRALHPINGVRAKMAPPPGWRAPIDWADYPRSLQSLQKKPAPTMAPTAVIEEILDRQHGRRGRVIYDCDRGPELTIPCHPPVVKEKSVQNTPPSD